MTTFKVGAEFNSDEFFDLQLTSGATVLPMYMCRPTGKRDTLYFVRNLMKREGIKMYSGTQRYADLEPPWTPVAQTDWSGGKGGKDFDRDASMYYDGYQVNTVRPGEIILGPKATETLNPTTTSSNTAGTTYNTITASASDYDYYAYKFTAGASLTVATVQIIVSTDGTMRVGLANKNGGTSNPESVTWSTNSFLGDIGSVGLVTFDVAKALTSGTDYYLVIELYDSTGSTAEALLKKSTTAASAYYTSETGADGTWSAGTDAVCPYYKLSTATYVNAKYIPFEYKGSLYAVGQNDAASSSKLYLNGDQGMCETTNTTTTVIKTHSGVRTWAADEAIGCILVLMSGVGDSQPQNWREITDNDASAAGPPITTSFTVSPPFDVAPDDTTQFAIVNSDDWTEITAFDTNYKLATSGLTPNVKDVLAVNGVVYFAMGDGHVMTRMWAYNSAGVWTYDFSDYGTYSAGSVTESGAFTYLGYASDQAGTYVWGAKGGYPSTIAYALAVDATSNSWTPAALTFSSAINVGDLQSRIRGLETYYYQYYSCLHVMKEDGPYYIFDKKPYKIDVREMENTTDWRTGAAHTVHGVYLYFSWHDSVVRYYNGSLDRVGPDKAEVGYPTANRVGHFTSLVGYPGLVIGSVDAGVNGTSSVLAYNGQGWCEWYQSSGQRIQNLYIQSIPGSTADKLWVSVGATLVWLPLSIDPYNHPDDSYPFATSGYLITSWFYLGLHAIDKLFNAIRLVVENTDDTGAGNLEYVTASYQKDDDSSWTDITGDYDSFSEEMDLASTPTVTGKRIRFRFTLNSHDGAETPRIIASVAEMFYSLPDKYITTVTVRFDPDDPDDYTSALTKFNVLKAMQDLVTPVTVESKVDIIDGTTCWVRNVIPRGYKKVNKQNTLSYVAQFDLYES